MERVLISRSVEKLVIMFFCIGITGGLECICTTEQCNKSNKIMCTAENTCYVQIMYDFTDTQENIKSMPMKTVRGCIDESMPLLCENRRPSGYSGPWPILHCCKNDWCNRDILPTDPPWLIEEILRIEKSKKEENNVNSEDWQRSDYNMDNTYDTSHHHNNNSRRDFNVIYIAAPLAGACVVLALVIFTLYLMKMNRRNVKRCVKNQQNHISSIYRQKLPLMVEVRDHQNFFHCAPVHHKGTRFKIVNKDTVCDVKTCPQSKLCDKITDHKSCDQCECSAGSETKLLV